MGITGHDVESPPKYEIAHDVVVQIRRPLRHIERLRPVLLDLAAGENHVSEGMHILH